MSSNKKRRGYRGPALKLTRLILLSLICGSFLYAGCKVYLFTIESDYFRIKKLRITPGVHVTTDDVISISGLTKNSRLFDLNLTRLAERIAAHPWIKGVHLKRSFPDGLVIEFEERKPVALAALKNLYYLDRTGNPFKKVDAGDNLDFPIITATPLDALFEGKKSSVVRDAIRIIELAKTGRNLKEEDISEIHWDEREGYIVYTTIGEVTIRFGRGNYERKWSYLEAVLKDLYDRGAVVNSINLKVPYRVSVQLKQNDLEIIEAETGKGDG